MKTTILILLCNILFLILPNSTILAQNTYNGYSDIINLSKETNKPVLLFFTANWCGPCHNLQKEIESLNSFFNKYYVVYNLDIDTEPEIVQLYQQAGLYNNSVPSYFILSSGGKTVLNRGIGYKSKSDFILWHNETYKKHKKHGSPIKKLLEKFI